MVRALDWSLLGMAVVAGIAALITLSQTCVPGCVEGADCWWTGCGAQNPFFWLTAAIAITTGVAVVARRRRSRP
jgi:hypothetical protein